MANPQIHQLWQRFLELNLYEKASSSPETIVKERLATRIYLGSLTASLLIIAVGSALLTRTVDRVESTPSVDRFVHLSSLYSDTLQCPCIKLGIDYNTFVTGHATFHQVCSSAFVQQTWIDSIYQEPNRSVTSFDDIRPVLAFFWQTIAGFCALSRKAWNDTVASFSASHLLAPVAIDDRLLRSQVQAALDAHISLTRSTVARDVLVLQRFIASNQLVSALTTNFYLRRPPTYPNDSNVLKTTPRTFGNCSCLNARGCPRSAIINDDGHDPSLPIPGLVMDCLVVDGTLASTLECYYQPACFSLLHPSPSASIPLLSSSSNKHFSFNDTVQSLFAEMMIDQLTTDIDFQSFYSGCQPNSCSYSFSQRFNLLYTVTIAIGVFGGLSTLVRVLASLVADFLHERKDRRAINIDATPAVAVPRRNPIQRIFEQLQSLLRRGRQLIINFNLFERRTQRTPDNIAHETALTRAFFLLLTVVTIAAASYIVVVEQNQLITVPSPSISVYQQLYADHSQTLQCPCSHISVPYSSFINLSVVLHQVCSSDLTSTVWLDFVTSFDPTLVPRWTDKPSSRDFRTIGASYFQQLALFCYIVQTTTDDAQWIVSRTRFVNDRMLPPTAFQQQIAGTVDSFISAAVADFNRVLAWIDAVIDNHLLTGGNVATTIFIDEMGQVKMEEASLLEDSNENYPDCFCSEYTDLCGLQAMIYTNDTQSSVADEFLYQLPITCIPLWGFIQSSTRWWYNQTYLAKIHRTYSNAIGHESSVMLKRLDPSVPTRIRVGNMEYMWDDMMTERWISENASFERFYAACAPVSCSYTIVGRRSILAISLLLISVCGGLNQGLRLLVPLLGNIVAWIVDRWRNRNTAQRGPRSIANRFKRALTVSYRSTVNINLFPSTFTDINHLQEQRLHTRVYLLIYSICLGVLLSYSGVIEQKIIKTHRLASIVDYEQLHAQQSGEINCPCERLSVPYKEFVTELRVDTFYPACRNGIIYTIIAMGKKDSDSRADLIAEVTVE